MVIASTLSSCSNFDDLNTNPDKTTTVSPSMLCTNALLSVLKFQGRDAKSFISDNALPKYIGYANETQIDNQYNRLGVIGFDEMTILPNLDKMLVYAQGSVMETSYRGVAKFVRASMFYKLTMRLGDIPYSETNQGELGNYRPKYDTQEEVLKGVLAELAEAEECFANGVNFTGDPTPYDGNAEKWRLAINAFRLKVLMSLSQKESNTILNIKNSFSEIVAGNKLLQNSTGFLGLIYQSRNLHPLHGTNDLFTSRTILSTTMVDSLTKWNDYRLFYIAKPSEALIAEGKSESEFDAYQGVDVSMIYNDMTANYLENKYSRINDRYLTEVAADPYIFISYAEQQLILAEGVLRGWITGDAESYYQEGVADALSLFKSIDKKWSHGREISQEYIDNYFTGEAAFKNTDAARMKQIWQQRYFLNFFQNSISSYFEYRRTGYPILPINPESSLNENKKDAIPVRWLYPSSESNTNRANLEAALNRQYEGYDEINKVMWLLK